MITRSPDEFIEEAHDRVLAEEGLSDDVIHLELSTYPPRLAMIDYLEVRNPIDRKKGIARRVLRLLIKLADESGFTLEVIPRSFNGLMGNEALAGWYERNGFYWAASMDSPRLMRRESQVAPTRISEEG